MSETNDSPDLYNSANHPSNKKYRLKLGFRALCVVLVVAIILMLLVWRPWEPYVRATNRTLSVSGTATVTATPDQYIFSPDYSFTETDQQTALSKLSQKSNQVVDKLKSLGVSSSDIQSNSNGYNKGLYLSPAGTNSNTYTLSLKITVNNASLAQKVQDYLLTTSPSGQVSPVAQFSNNMQQSLQNDARQKAEQNARSQAEQSAKNLGFNIGAVKSVDDSSNSDFTTRGITSTTNGAVDSSQPQLNVQPGQNDLSYSVSVVYYIK